MNPICLTYTCDEVPDAGQAKLNPSENGGKWFALHATNSVLEWLSHDPPLLPHYGSPDFAEVLGSISPSGRAHQVEVTAPEHPMMAGIEAETADELISEYHGEREAGEHRWTGKVDAFQERGVGGGQRAAVDTCVMIKARFCILLRALQTTTTCSL